MSLDVSYNLGVFRETRDFKVAAPQTLFEKIISRPLGNILNLPLNYPIFSKTFKHFSQKEALVCFMVKQIGLTTLSKIGLFHWRNTLFCMGRRSYCCFKTKLRTFF